MATLSDYFERICILNLPYKPERRERLTRHLAEQGFEKNITWMRSYSGDKMPPPAWWNAGNGAWGCHLSHARVLAEAIADGIENVLILEDDVVFQPDAAPLLKGFMKQVPEDWGQIYLGGQHLKDPTTVVGSPFVLRCHCVNRTHAFAVHKRAMVRMHQHIWHAPDYMQRPGGWHIDHQLGVAHERGDWPVYGPSYWIAGQDAEWSNISGRYNSRHWWHPRTWSKHLPFIWVPPSVGTSLHGDERWLHGGYNLKPNTFEDIGLDVAAISDDRLSAWLDVAAREALDIEKLPAVQHPYIGIDRLKRIWRAGAIPWAPRCAQRTVRTQLHDLRTRVLELSNEENDIPQDGAPPQAASPVLTAD